MMVELSWRFFCLWFGPILWLYWKAVPDQAVDNVATMIATTALKAKSEIIEQATQILTSLRTNGIEGRPDFKVGPGHVIMPPEGELLELQGGTRLFWCSSTMGDQIVARATEIVRHRAKHYSLGNLTTLLPKEP